MRKPQREPSKLWRITTHRFRLGRARHLVVYPSTERPGCDTGPSLYGLFDHQRMSARTSLWARAYALRRQGLGTRQEPPSTITLSRSSRSSSLPVTVGGTEFVGVRLPAALTEQIDAWANTNGVGRSEAVRRLIETGLAATKAKR